MIGGSILVLISGYVFAQFGSERTYLDAFTTVFSFIATYWLTQKRLEHWLYWIVIDFASIFLYGSRGYNLYAILFLIYTIIAFLAYFRWKREMS